jgi:hypothetical protein
MKKIELYENFLSEELFLELKEYVKKLKSNKATEFTTSTTVWPVDNIMYSTPILRYILSENNIELHNKIIKTIKEKTEFYGGIIVLHMWPPLSYLGWHTDDHVKAAFTLYINDNWNEDWGGYLMYENDNEQVECIKPKKNLGVLQQNNVRHCVSTINSGSEMRISLQIFLEKEKSKPKLI